MFPVHQALGCTGVMLGDSKREKDMYGKKMKRGRKTMR